VREIVPGVVHWTTFHEGIGEQVSSYYVVEGGVLLDPRAPDEGGFEALAERYGEPRAVVLTNRHHYRHTGQVLERWDVTVHCHVSGLYEFTQEQRVQGFAFGDALPGGAVAEELGVLCPDETAVWFARLRVLAMADALVRQPPDAEPGFVPDELIGDDPEAVKAGLRQGFARLAALGPEHVLLAHGLPIVGEGRAALERAAAG
jgi:hypothetical protein